MIDHSESRAVLIGVSRYADSTILDVPAAANSLREFHALLTDPDLCGWPADRVTVIENPPTASKLAQLLRRLAAETTATLLIYFVGHGMLTDSGDLCLAVSETELVDPDLTGLEYRHVRRAILDSLAQSKIIILDCCYSGKAIQTLTAGETNLADAALIAGAYTLTASDNAAHVPSLIEQADRLTSFTGVFIDVVRDGLVGNQEWLVLSLIYSELERRLRARGLPRPNQRGTDTIQLYPFSRNAAFVANDAVDAVTHYALSVTDDTLYFDLAELGRQTMNLLQQQPRLPLTPEVLEHIRDGSGLYQLSRADGAAEEVIYLGAATRGLPQRLMRHWKKISGRRFLPSEQIHFCHLYFDGDPSVLIQPVLRSGFRVPSWNQNGFGNHDPGRARDRAIVRADHFDALYPIDLDYLVESFSSGPQSLSLVLREVTARLPYQFRYERTAPEFDQLTIEIPVGPISADELFRRITAVAGDAWQLTALPGHTILYREHTSYPAAIRYYRATIVTDRAP
jgi:hypothetical protein